ncbi:hypothetical protein AMJ51_00185, partial [Microgenomates bacterium DG_75]
KEGEAYQNINQDFNWGVLAINPNKSIYPEYEEAKIYFGVLDEKGHTICNARLRLEIKTPDGQAHVLSTEEGTINSSGCVGDNFTYTPDYSTNYKVGGEGTYQLELTAETKNGKYQIRDSFQVAKKKDWSNKN